MHPGSIGADRREAVVEVHHDRCSTAPDAVRLAALLRARRGVENHCRQVLDVTFGEDLCGTGDATVSRNLFFGRGMAVGMLRAPPKALTLKPEWAALDRADSLCLGIFIRKP